MLGQACIAEAERQRHSIILHVLGRAQRKYKIHHMIDNRCRLRSVCSAYISDRPGSTTEEEG